MFLSYDLSILKDFDTNMIRSSVIQCVLFFVEIKYVDLTHRHTLAVSLAFGKPILAQC